MKKNAADKEEEFEISDLLFKYLPYWPLFLFLTVFSLGIAFLYLRYKIPIYDISANILIKDEQKGIDESSIMESLDLFGSKKIVENEIEVLKSKLLMKQVVNNLQLYAPVFEEGTIKDGSAYIASPVKVDAKNPETLHEVQKVYFVYDSARKTIKLDNKPYPLYSWFVYQGDTLRFTPNPRYSAPSVKRQLYFSIASLKREAIGLSSNLVISPVSKQATVINLSIKDEVPRRGEDILNELIKVYSAAAIEDKNILASNTLAFVEDRLKSVTRELEEVESNIEKFKTKKGIVDISAQGELFLQSVETSDQKIAEMNMQLAILEQVEKYVLSRETNAGIVPSTLGVTDPVLSQLLQTLYELQLQYERLRKTTAENNPLLISLSNQIEKIRPNVLESIRSQRSNLSAGKNNLKVNSNRYSSMLRSIPQNERELLEISRQQAIKNNIYSFLLQKREETALSFASTVSDSRIVDPAEASLMPVSPKRNTVYILAVVGAIVLSVAVVYTKELLNQNILFRSEIEKFVSWPVIGEIALDNSAEKIVIKEGNRNVIAEQFRQLRTSLDYLGINDTHKKILFTSSISGEGKSFIAANMAMSLALVDKKVVLLELDLRKPKLSPIFNVASGVTGISNYLIGKASVEEIVKSTTLNKNLYFIPSGPIPPNPAELILKPDMQRLLKELENRFDYVLIDTAPVAPVTDAHILSKFCDATLYIVRHAYTPKMHIKRLEENNKIRGLKNVAIIFNGLKGRGFGKYSYGYGYGYGYAYGYE